MNKNDLKLEGDQNFMNISQDQTQDLDRMQTNKFFALLNTKKLQTLITLSARQFKEKQFDIAPEPKIKLFIKQPDDKIDQCTITVQNQKLKIMCLFPQMKTQKLKNIWFRPYVNLCLKKHLQRRNIRIGCTNEYKNTDNQLQVKLNTRIKYFREQFYFWLYHKGMINYRNFNLRYLTVFDLTRKKLAKKDIQIKYSLQNNQWKLNLFQDWQYPTRNFRDITQYFTNIEFGYNKKLNQSFTAGLNIKSEPKYLWQAKIFELLMKYKPNQNLQFKTKFNSKLDFNGFVHKILDKNNQVQFGFYVPCEDFKWKNIKFRMGLYLN